MRFLAILVPLFVISSEVFAIDIKFLNSQGEQLKIVLGVDFCVDKNIPPNYIGEISSGLERVNKEIGQKVFKITCMLDPNDFEAKLGDGVNLISMINQGPGTGEKWQKSRSTLKWAGRDVTEIDLSIYQNTIHLDEPLYLQMAIHDILIKMITIPDYPKEI